MSAEEEAARLARLPAAERRKVLALLSSLTTTTVEVEDSLEGEVLRAVNEELRRRGMRAIPFPQLRASRGYPAFREGSAIVADFIRETVRARRGAETRKALVVLVRALLRRMKAERVPLSPGSISVHLRRVPDVCEDSFPGYSSSGLLRFIVTSHRITP